MKSSLRHLSVRPRARRGRSSLLAKVVLSLFVVKAVHYGGAKTNGVNNIPPRMAPVVATVSAEEIARGWRVAGVATNAGVSYAMPAGVEPTFNWHRRGTFGEWRRLDLGDFAFPFGTNDETVSSFSAFSDGRIRPTPRDAEREIRAVGVPMLAMQGTSRFWTSDGVNGSRLLTWEGFFLDADTNAPVSAQIELRPSGDFVARSNAVETCYVRVNPNDWDGDGIHNERDARPTVSDGDFFGAANALPAGANEGAYYWLDLAATGGLGVATIRVTCDGPSDLGDHVIVARTNQVCHVPLLAGATYFVESDLPIGHASASSEYAQVETNAATSLTVALPLELFFEHVPMRGGSGNYVAHTSPVDVAPRILSVSGGCCPCATNATGFSWVCGANCNCGGYWHDLAATAVWGGYSRLFDWSGWCPCHYADEIESRGVDLAILDASGSAIDWKDPVLVGESLVVEVTVGGEEMSTEDFVGLFAGRIRLKAYYVDFGGEHDIAAAAIPVGAANVASRGQNVFRVSVSSGWLQSNGVVRNADDGIAAKTSIDMSEAESGESSRQDSDIFDSQVVGRLYGRARGKNGSGNAGAAIPEGAFNLKTVQSGGTACLVAVVGSACSQKKQCQQQADFVYFSCHGSHATGDIADIDQNCYSCDSVAAKWGDVDIVVIAGCSVLDIGNFRAESFSTSTKLKRWWSAGGDSSPGEKWESKGAKIYLGYAWTAPTDADGGTAIATTFTREVASGRDWVEAWRIANDSDAGRNACAIDCRNEQHVFWYWREVSGVAIWTSVTKGGPSWE